MKRIRLLLAALVFASAAYAQVPFTMNFQGILTDPSTGKAVADGSYSMTFNIYDVDVSGSAIWTESHPSIGVTSGIYEVILGSNGSPLDVLPFDKQYYLEVKIGSETLTPRIKLSTAPYSFTSRQLNGVSNLVPANGWVGIGTLSPISRLHIEGDTGDLTLEENNETTSSSSISFRRSRGSPPTLSDLADNDRLGAIFYTGQIGGSYNQLALWATYYKDNGGNPGARSVFTSKDIGGTLQTRLMIDENGNIGIGKDNPAYMLDVGGASGGHFDNNLGIGFPGIPSSSGVIIGNIGFTGLDNTSTVKEGASIWAVSQNDWNGGYLGTNLNFAAKSSTGGTGEMAFTGDNKLGIGTLTPNYNLEVIGNARFSNIPSGTYTTNLGIDATGALVAGSTSDIRLKTNISDLHDALETVMKLQGRYFNWKSEPDGTRKIGLIAQEVERVIPELVFTNKVDGYKGVQYPEMSAVLIEAIKEQQQIIESQQQQINDMQDRLQKLEQKLELQVSQVSNK